MLKGILLTSGSYYGSLAAARMYHKHGLPVILADHVPFNFCRSSRSVQKFYMAPSSEDLTSFAKWLLDFGAAMPGYFLYPTSDDLCWVIAKHRQKLKQFYVFDYPEISVIRNLLDKASLYQMAATVGIDVPPSVLSSEIATTNDTRLKYPVILKPRTQAGMRSKVKGIVVRNPKELPSRIAEFRRLVVYDAEVIADLPDVAEPMIQKFFASARSSTYSLAGYISHDGRHFMVQASMKILQNPPNVGVGICFQSVPVVEDLAAKIRVFCQSVGYYGVFEAEFIREKSDGEEKFLLMDFNPRFYGQMAFEIQRGLPLPMCLLYDLQCREDELIKIQKNLSERKPEVTRFRHRVLLHILLCTQVLGGKMPVKTWLHWTKWANKRGFDPILDRKDLLPLFVDLMMMVRKFIRHPRSSFKHYFR
ncbi:MAG: hypothetical protein ACOH5I_13855 [Oligoflexus sp.]